MVYTTNSFDESMVFGAINLIIADGKLKPASCIGMAIGKDSSGFFHGIATFRNRFSLEKDSNVRRVTAFFGATRVIEVTLIATRCLELSFTVVALVLTKLS